MVNDQKRVLWEGECKFEMLKVNEKGPNKPKTPVQEVLQKA